MKVKLLYETKTFEIEINENDKINEIKLNILNEIQLEVEYQKWVYKGKILQNKENLIYYNFNDGDVIHIVKSIPKPINNENTTPTSTNPTTTTTNPTTSLSSIPTPSITSTTNSSTSNSSSFVSNPSIPRPQVNLPTTNILSVPHFDQSMGYFLENNNDVEEIKNCLSTLSKIVTNIIDNPHDEKYLMNLIQQ